MNQTESTMQSLLAQQFGLDASNPQAMAEAIGQRMGNPMLGMLMQQWMARQSEAQLEAIDVETVEHISSPDIDAVRKERSLRQTLHAQQQALAQADRMASFIAESFGCCKFCWGLNRLCGHCAGRGRPGYADPDLEILRDWLAPALARAGWQLLAPKAH